MRLRYSLLFLLLSTFLVGCVSTQKRYERALDLEAEGRYADAVRYYAKVIDREPGYADARARLVSAGAEAVALLLDQARAAEGVGDFEAAVRAVAQLDEVRRTAAGAGVPLEVPADYDAYRQDLEDGAVMSLVQRGEREEARGRWGEALRAYERAQDRYAMSTATYAELDRARARVHVRWAEEDFARGRFRAAFGRAQQALDLVGPEAMPLAAELQAEAVAVGTRHVAYLPLGMTEAVGRALPRHVLQDLNDVLVYEHWAAPPPFLASVDPSTTRRELRRHEGRGAAAGPDVARSVGRALDVDFVVYGDVVDFTEAEVDKREVVRPARRRGADAADTSYVDETFTLVMTSRTAIRVVDPASGRLVYEGVEDAEVREPMRRAVYSGDERELVLSAAERRLFDREAERRTVRALEEELVDVLAGRLAARTYDVLLDRID